MVRARKWHNFTTKAKGGSLQISLADVPMICPPKSIVLRHEGRGLCGPRVHTMRMMTDTLSSNAYAIAGVPSVMFYPSPFCTRPTEGVQP
jgi:hypothetical protein